MSIISKRYLRYLPYILLFVFIEKSILFVPWRQSNFPFHKRVDHIRTHSNVREWLRSNSLEHIDEYDHVAVNVGIVQCFHLGDWWSRCSVRNELRKDAISSRRKVIWKDLLGPTRFKWVGFSDYLFYDTLSVYDLSQLEEEDKGKQVLLISISGEPVEGEGNSEIVDTFYVNYVPLQIENLVNGRPVISDISVLFGEDCVDPRKNWELDRSWVFKMGEFPSFITTRRLSTKYLEDWRPRLTVGEDGAYKIVQLADLHFGVGKGECLDEFPAHDHCEADPKTTKFVEEVLDIEQPDMVIFTGDQIMGSRSKQDSETALLKTLAPVISKGIPWAMVWGNHDDEGTLNRWELSKFVNDLPLSLFMVGPKDTADNTFGVGNYFHQVMDFENRQPVLTFYFLDSHKYSTTGKIFPGYDWIKEDQWDYFKRIYDEKLYQHIRNTQKPHLSMAFFHIPTPEYLHEASRERPGESNPIIGNPMEGVTAPRYDSKAAAALAHMNVQAASCGHDHSNDYCLLDDSSPQKIWFCYGGAVGEGGYGDHNDGYERRVRIYHFETKDGNIYTWKRLNSSPINYFDYQLIASGGVSKTG
ncbi:ZYRO0B07898p [Zygosaccharomyces rouxii]|uniref:ZYRO0B07898p n=1 Tax=Zygosaccharomyces rouxii (strain ATCC 2623 / CBS 732 / NBRC 1130 / NCYC 568 / NRRL Y-229) TaxID=559307 RepID=C5DRE8_ZYGRC|nr:uncharacterized protein ZYRO0B07898g [Zygosaccharomyces rouxii]KAH9200100.1 Metallo-dependent phosphatase-like protein [Zygosaccharomyces rouxii]CAR26359.1 ZYRO0B07898p [Zygosaccharomyces rouxii]